MKSIITVSLMVLNIIVLQGQEINWLTWEEVEEKMHEEPRKIIVDVYTEWCGWCKKMDASTFQNPQVVDYINKNYYAIRFDAEYEKPILLNGKEYNFVKTGRKGYHELAAKILRGKLSYPSIVFLDYNIKVIQPLAGYQDVKTMKMVLAYFHEDYHKTTPWKTFAQNYEKKISNPNLSNDQFPIQTVGN